MFLRFVVGLEDEHHKSLTGIVTEARLLRERGVLASYEVDRLEKIVDDVAAGANRVVALFRVGAERDGRRFEWDAIEVFRVSEGRIAEYWGFVADQYAVDEFLS